MPKIGDLAKNELLHFVLNFNHGKFYHNILCFLPKSIDLITGICYYIKGFVYESYKFVTDTTRLTHPRNLR